MTITITLTHVGNENIAYWWLMAIRYQCESIDRITHCGMPEEASLDKTLNDYLETIDLII